MMETVQTHVDCSVRMRSRLIRSDLVFTKDRISVTDLYARDATENKLVNDILPQLPDTETEKALEGSLRYESAEPGNFVSIDRAENHTLSYAVVAMTERIL